MGSKSVHFTPQAQHVFVFFHQHGQQHDLKWKEMGGVGGGRQVMSGGGQKIVESTLVLSA